MILKLIHKAGSMCVQFIFPRMCLECGKPGKYFCLACLNRIQVPPPFELENVDKVIAVSSYHKPSIKKAVRQLKYHHSQDLKKELVELMYGAINQHLDTLPPQTKILAIPITEKRRRWRGFNQSELLAWELSKKLNLPFSHGLLKIRETRPQTEIKNRKERLENIKGAFAIMPGYTPPNTIMIVDDISTTGATLNEAARVLKNAGAQKIIGVVIAKG
ncbi:ComF family protein [Patescibacteria group bacterium]|nr:ComF family protein [Patescibacteria group bacterium]